MNKFYFWGWMFLLNMLSLVIKAQSYVANTANSNATYFNTLVGPSAGLYTTGQSNVFLGYYAGQTNTGGSFNSFLGYYAGQVNTTGSLNTFLGSNAGESNITGYRNTFIGEGTGSSNTTGFGNVSLGGESSFKNKTGHNNLMVGDSAGFNNITSGNVFLGSKAGYANQTGSQNTFLGYQTGYNSTASSNTFMGFNAGRNTSSGQANVFVGSEAGLNNKTGLGNMFLGQQAGVNNISGNYNLFVGNSSGSNNNNGVGNTAIGDGSGLHNTSGQQNVSIGQYAGLNNQTGSQNVFIGYGAKAGNNNPTNLTNAVAIGANAIVSQNNSMVLGSGVNVAIGNSAPSTKLHITTGASNTSGLRLENLTSNSPASVTSQYKFLTVDGAGNVILGSVNGSAREAATESFWQRNKGYLQSSQNDAVIIGNAGEKTPTGYKLYVEQGILTEKVKVAVKGTADWSDKVFAPTYQLQSLIEVERYILANQHLPGVPSAEQMVEHGNDLHKTDAKLLEKIEELTLYSIQLEKARQQQQVEINELKQLVKQLLDKK